MKATTVKIEGDLLHELERIKPKEQSVSAFVRRIILREIERERALHAAEEYRAFLLQNRAEAEWVAEWERADLGSPIDRSAGS